MSELRSIQFTPQCVDKITSGQVRTAFHVGAFSEGDALLMQVSDGVALFAMAWIEGVEQTVINAYPSDRGDTYTVRVGKRFVDPEEFARDCAFTSAAAMVAALRAAHPESSDTFVGCLITWGEVYTPDLPDCGPELEWEHGFDGASWAHALCHRATRKCLATFYRAGKSGAYSWRISDRYAGPLNRPNASLHDLVRAFVTYHRDELPTMLASYRTEVPQ
jgi:hypothetical protein